MKSNGIGELGDWETGIGEADYAPAPVRVIPVTEEMRARDAAERAARENPASAWTIKASLSQENLRGIRREAIIRRKQKAERASRPQKPRRPRAVSSGPPICPICQGPRTRQAARCGRCAGIARRKREVLVCTSCQQPIARHTVGTLCRACWKAQPRERKPQPVPWRCADCGEEVDRRHRSSFCRACAPKHSIHERHAPNPRRQWTAEEDEFLRKLYADKQHHMSYSIHSRAKEVLGVSKGAVFNRARELGLTEVATGRSHMQFTVKEAVPLTQVPQTKVGRKSAFPALLEKVYGLQPETALPIEFENEKQGYNAVSVMRQLAKTKGDKLAIRRDGRTFFFSIAAKTASE